MKGTEDPSLGLVHRRRFTLNPTGTSDRSTYCIIDFINRSRAKTSSGIDGLQLLWAGTRYCSRKPADKPGGVRAFSPSSFTPNSDPPWDATADRLGSYTRSERLRV